MKIAVCSLSIGDEFRQITRNGIKSKKLYCEKHGYTFIDDESVYDNTRPHAWSKILLVKKYLQEYDYIMWIDGDTFIMNDEITIEERLQKLNPEDKDLLLANDHVCANTGVFFIKNTEFSMQLLDEIYKQTYFVNNPLFGDYEQNAYIKLYDDNWNNIQTHVKTIRYPYQIEFNSYWCNYYYGHFILHFAGCRNKNDLRLCMEKFCPIKKDEESDESFKSRIKWLIEDSRKEADRMIGR